jgi:hypothetical protein
MTHANAEAEISQAIAASAIGKALNVQFTVAILNSRRDDIKLPYVMVAVDMVSGKTNLDEISCVVRLLANYFAGNKLSDVYGGLEILFRAGAGRALIRFARISLLPEGIERAKSVSVNDLKSSRPFSGAATIVYDKELLCT